MEQERKLGIVVQSGAANRICCVVVYSASALASGWKVVLHLVNEGLIAFRKDTAKKVWASLNPKDFSVYPSYYAPNVEVFLKNLQEFIKSGKFQDWPDYLTMLKKEYPDRFRIYACPIAAAAYNIKKEDLLDIVDEIKGGESFLEEVYPGVVMVF
ncbi:MAG: DsrE/DsrF/DrsH-like family protein [Saccharolobus sp.]|uniref:NADH dehydrogenase n=1 Tax=Saccharolobus shibatae TaxID=2286 RepID=A0A8F5C0N9_9CREN|nr:DsrE/DsrF/DrsH-like family protein [Saccharolobus shibatae]MCH4816323.1 DsrE/DsrF/DrsH-like family protein [Saccharolobus shibatae]QXJ34974.1 NADH dehydrogenase [Saccharolobus shibatae]